ncbi:MAG: hypothetical protein ABWZ25_17845 [Chitinophagaceae bacterium]
MKPVLSGLNETIAVILLLALVAGAAASRLFKEFLSWLLFKLYQVFIGSPRSD